MERERQREREREIKRERERERGGLRGGYRLLELPRLGQSLHTRSRVRQLNNAAFPPQRNAETSLCYGTAQIETLIDTADSPGSF